MKLMKSALLVTLLSLGLDAIAEKIPFLNYSRAEAGQNATSNGRQKH